VLGLSYIPEQAAVVLRRDLPLPAPGPGEVLIRVRCAGICATDLELARGYMHHAGVLGHEFVGIVERGPAALEGRRVVGEINCACHACDLCRRGLTTHCTRRTVLGIQGRPGAFAEFLALPADNCHVVQDDVNDREAVFTEPLAAAAHVLNAATFTAGRQVAVLGAGRLGLLVAQVLAHHPVQLEVLGRNPRTLALCARWGLAARPADGAPAAAYDVVVECTGAPDGLARALALCRPRGTIVLKSTYARAAPPDLAPAVIHALAIVGSRCGAFPPALQLLAERRVRLAELVSATFPLTHGVAAFAAAAQPGALKVLLEMEPR
jgi:threonine dehydrogenase-like Zn-dependent dehydrogenase